MKVLTAKQLTLAYARHISSTLAKPIDVAQSWSSPKTAGLESSRSWQLMHQSCKAKQRYQERGLHFIAELPDASKQPSSRADHNADSGFGIWD